MRRNKVCINRNVVRLGGLLLVLGAAATLAQQAPDLRRYIKFESM